MKNLLNLLVMLALLPCLGAAELEVIVTGLAHPRGQVIVAVWTSKETFLKSPARSLPAEIDPRTLTARVHFTGLPDQPFAVSAFHDENGNGVLDTNFLGIPKEPVAFAHNAKGRLGPPDYAQAVIVPAEQKGPLTLNLGAAH